MPTTLQPITKTSSLVAATGFDEDAGDLHVQFKTGETYAYHGVPAAMHASLRDAESPGRFFAANIKGHFKHEKV